MVNKKIKNLLLTIIFVLVTTFSFSQRMTYSIEEMGHRFKDNKEWVAEYRNDLFVAVDFSKSLYTIINGKVVKDYIILDIDTETEFYGQTEIFLTLECLSPSGHETIVTFIDRNGVIIIHHEMKALEVYYIIREVLKN